MATTSAGLWFPDGTDNISPLNPVLGAMQASVGNNPRLDTPAGIHSVADAAGLTSLATNLTNAGYAISVSNPAYAYRADTQMIYENRGSGWAPYSNTLQFADATARDTALPAPPAGIVAVIGAGSAMAVTVWDGSTWVTIWQPNGAWVDLPLAAGFAHQGAYTAQYRLTGTGYVEFRWGISNAGLSANAGHTIVAAGGLPANVRAGRDKYFPIASSTAAAAGRMSILPNGAVTVNTPASLGSWYMFDIVRYMAGG